MQISRSIGDFQIKSKEYGENNKALIPIPEILSFQTNKYTDFIILGCKLNNLIILFS